MHRYSMVLVLGAWLCACEGDDGEGGGGASGGGAGIGGFANQTCETLNACGGDVDGTWTVEALCVADAARLAGMSTDEPDCADLFVAAQTDGTGTASFSNGSVSSSISLTMDLHAVWTPACIQAVSGVQSVDIVATCARLDQEYAENPNFTGGSCMTVAGNCECIVSAERPFDLGTAYTLAGERLTFAGDASPTDYCVQADRLQLSASMGGERILLTLTR